MHASEKTNQMCQANWKIIYKPESAQEKEIYVEAGTGFVLLEK